MSAASSFSNTRATRSRFSSPQTSAAAANGTTDPSRAQGSGIADGPNNTTGEGQKQQSIQRWLEPPVQVKASYHDAGLIRQGVFENMAPLGTLPKVGLFRKTAPPPAATPELTHKPPPVRIVIKPRAAVPSAPVPAPPPAPEEDETEEEDVGNAEDLQAQGEDDREADGDDEAAEGEHDNKTRAPTAASRSRRSVVSGETDDEDWAPAKAAMKGAGSRSMSRASRRLSSVSSVQQPAAIARPRPVDRKAALDKVVEVAVDEALTHFRYPTAWALRTLYDENSSRPEFLDMIEKVFLQTATNTALEEFARLVQSKKREGKKDNKGYFYFVPLSPNSDSTPPLPRRAPYGNLVRFDLSTLHLDQPGKSLILNLKRTQPAPEPEADRVPEPEAAAAAAAAAPDESELHPRKKRKSGKHSTPAAKMSANGVNGKANAETPSRRRGRARSMSSTSSLSSARSLSPPVEIPESDAGDEGSGFEDTPSRTSPAPPPPITAPKRRRSNAPRKSRNVSPSSRPSPAASTAPQQPPKQTPAAAPSHRSAPSQRQSPAVEQFADDAVHQPYEMPAVVDAPLFPNLNSKKGGRSGAPTPVSFASKVGKIDDHDKKQRLRQIARNITANCDEPVPMSHAREASAQVASLLEEMGRASTPAPAARPRTSLVAAHPTPAPREGRSTRSALKRTYDDLDEQASPTTTNFPGSEAASIAADSRPGTPALRPAKKPRTGLRIKNSPIKKKNGGFAGIPRPSGERSSPVGNGNVIREDDNDDYCSSCGGNGQLVCCDGCTRSFHVRCVDPVMDPEIPIEWYCNVCRTRRAPSGFPMHSGAFASMLEKLDAQNTSAYRLPGKVRNHFEGVRAGVDGEYEEVVPVVKPTRKKKADEEQAPDAFKLRDAEGNAAICHGCLKGTKGPQGNRAIIQCNLCSSWWHLDCLDPPLASPPLLRTWKCPLHVDDLLSKGPVQLAPAHRFRKVKNAPVIKPIYSRGFVNNGYVEIDLDESVEEEDENESGWRDVATYGRIVRLPEKGIKLDFLSRAREERKAYEEQKAHERLEKRKALRENRKGKPIPALNVADPVNALLGRIVDPDERVAMGELQAALNLASLSSNGGDGVTALINAMVYQADPSVIDMMARAKPSHMEAPNRLDQMDQQSLRAMLARAEAMTDEIRGLLAKATPNQQPLPQPSGTPNKAASAIANSQSPDGGDHSDTSMNMDPALETDAAKSPPSPATTDDVPAMTQGEKTPVGLGDQSPAAPLPLEESAAVVGHGATPSKAAALAGLGGEGPVVFGGGDEKGLDLVE